MDKSPLDYKTQNSSHLKQDNSFYDMHKSFITPLVKDKGIVFFEGEYIYWKPSAILPYATTMNSIFPNGVPINNTGNKVATNKKIHSVSFNMQSGFRILAGAYLPVEGWTTSATYQYLSKTATANTQGPPRNNTALNSENLNLAAVWQSVYLANNASSKLTNANATQKFNYKIFDWIFKKALYFQEKYGLFPYCGVRGAWIDNKLDVLYKGVYISGSTLIDLQDNAKIKTAYYGWGLRGGLEGSWLLGYGFEIFGNSALSLLWGKQNFRNTENFIAVINSIQRPGSVDGNIQFNVVHYAIELGFGINWGLHLYNDSMYLGLKILYEATLWPDLIQVRRILREEETLTSSMQAFASPFDATLDSSLSVNGLTIGLKLDF